MENEAHKRFKTGKEVGLGLTFTIYLGCILLEMYLFKLSPLMY